MAEQVREDDFLENRSLITTIMDSILLRVVVIGLSLLLLGAVLRTGVWAAVLGIWGVGMMILGLSIYGLIWWSHQ